MKETGIIEISKLPLLFNVMSQYSINIDLYVSVDSCRVSCS